LPYLTYLARSAPLLLHHPTLLTRRRRARAAMAYKRASTLMTGLPDQDRGWEEVQVRGGRGVLQRCG
jgi:hypothetical protein